MADAVNDALADETIVNQQIQHYSGLRSSTSTDRTLDEVMSNGLQCVHMHINSAGEGDTDVLLLERVKHWKVSNILLPQTTAKNWQWGSFFI